MNRLLAFAALTAAYGACVGLLRLLPEAAGGVLLLRAGAVTPVAWAGLYGVCVSAAWWLWRGPAGRASLGSWLGWMVYAPLLAALFFGANGGLAALHGTGRPQAQVAEALGGLEVWFVFCPGVWSLALGGALHAALARRHAGAQRTMAA